MASFLFVIAFLILTFQGPRSQHKQIFASASFQTFSSWNDTEGVRPDNAADREPDVLGDETCDDLKEVYKRGFLTKKQRKSYCLRKCKFLTISCEVVEENTTRRAMYSKVLNWTERFIEGKVVFDDDVEIAPEIMVIWQELWGRHWVVLLAFIPILLNQYKYYNWPFAVFWGAIFILFNMLGLGTSIGAFHNVAIAVICMVFPANSASLGETILACVFINFILCFAFVQDYALQIFFLATGLVGYFCYLHWTFFVRRHSSGAGIFVIMTQVAVLHEQLNHMREQYSLDSFLDVGMQTFFNAVLPGGKYRFFGKNAAVIAAKLVTHLDVSGNRFAQFMIFFVVEIGMFFAFRSCLGAFYIHSLRYRTDSKSLWYGLIVYMVDFWGPIRTVYRIILKYEEPNFRRSMYAACGVLMLAAEFESAMGVFWFRLLATIVDKCFIQSTYGKQTHYLMMGMDFMQASFPQDNATSWCSLNAVNGIARRTDRMHVRRDDGNIRGMGVVVRNKGMNQLYSVHHVVEGAKSIVFQESDIPLGFKPVNDAVDPMMAVVLGDEPAEEIDLLREDEASLVEQVMFINVIVDRKGDVVDKALCIVPNFRFSDGHLRATICLKKGDSGGPAIAWLPDGELRLCGCVSRGDTDRACGNIVSVSFLSIAVKHCKAIADFNKIRRGVSKRHCPFTALNVCLMENRDTLFEIAQLDFEYEYKGFVDVNKLEEALLEASCLGEGTERNSDEGQAQNNGNDDRENDHDDDYDAGPRRKRGRQNARRRNKDKAARKRGHFAEILEEVLTCLRKAYGTVVAQEVFAAIMDGRDIPELFGPDRFVVTKDGRIVVVKQD